MPFARPWNRVKFRVYRRTVRKSGQAPRGVCGRHVYGQAPQLPDVSWKSGEDWTRPSDNSDKLFVLNLRLFAPCASRHLPASTTSGALAERLEVPDKSEHGPVHVVCCWKSGQDVQFFQTEEVVRVRGLVPTSLNHGHDWSNFVATLTTGPFTNKAYCYRSAQFLSLTWRSKKYTKHVGMRHYIRLWRDLDIAIHPNDCNLVVLNTYHL